MNRREMLVAMGIVAAATPVFAAPLGSKNGNVRQRTFDVVDFGAVADGTTLDSASINKAIDACNSSGGGTVYVSPGTYLCGTVILKSDVTLYLEAGATLLGSKNIRDYLPQRQSQNPDTAQDNPVFVNDLRDAGSYHLIFARDAE